MDFCQLDVEDTRSRLDDGSKYDYLFEDGYAHSDGTRFCEGLSIVEKSWLSRKHESTIRTSQSWWLRIFDGNSSYIENLALDVYLDCPQDDFREYGRLRQYPYWSEMQVFLLSIGQYDTSHCGLILAQRSSGDYFRVGVFFSSFSRDPDGFLNDNDEQWEARKREQVFWLLSSDPQTITLV